VDELAVPLSASAPVVKLNDAELADLRLHLDGVRLPWAVLGGSAAHPGVVGPASSRLISVVVGGDVDLQPASRGRLLLQDHENAPVAVLVGATAIGNGPAGAVACGEIEAMTKSPRLTGAPGHDQPGSVVVVAMRPWLEADTKALGLQPPAAGPAPRQVIVLVPSESPSPDGVPARTLHRSVDSAVAGLPGVEVRSAPLVWRDPESDQALALAVAESFASSRTDILRPDDAAWQRVLAALSAGEPLPSNALADDAAGALLQWRPPRGQRGLVVMFTGLSGSGKSTVATALVSWLQANTDRTVTLLDGDIVRRMLSSELGFDLASRDLNIRRIGFVASEIARHHGIAICSPIAPFSSSREAVRAMVEPLGTFVLIHVATPLAECERRDRKGLYASARAGQLKEFTGISSPYEVPTDADLTLDTSGSTVAESLAQVLALLRAGHWLPPEQ
jgi:sulfate adenylyltransferase